MYEWCASTPADSTRDNPKSATFAVCFGYVKRMASQQHARNTAATDRLRAAEQHIARSEVLVHDTLVREMTHARRDVAQELKLHRLPVQPETREHTTRDSNTASIVTPRMSNSVRNEPPVVDTRACQRARNVESQPHQP
jgi:hypothetical protein